MHHIGVDVGGTFTDIFMTGDNGIEIHKVPSTPHDPSVATVEGMREACEKHGLTLNDLTLVFHGTTVATNTVLQRSGAKVALLTTHGFRDIIHIARHKKPLNFSLQQSLPWQEQPLVERELRLTAHERVSGPEGEVLEPLRPEDVRAAVDVMKGAGVEAIAVCFLHSFLNPVNEIAAAKILSEEIPDAYLSVRHEVCPEYREYEAFNTVVLNAYLGPVAGRYLGWLNERLADAGRHADVLFMTSTGGVEVSESVAAKPVSMVLSGPVGGVVGGLAASRASGFEDIITLDVGGTSADIALVKDGVLRNKHWLDNSIGDLQLRLSMVDVSTIGAGGGSIAAVDHGGMLQVGPASAGADPGPACYGRGGSDATVTDAQVVLGRLGEASFLGGRMTVEANRATDALSKMVAEPLGLETADAAAGVIRVATAHMVDAIELTSVRRGHDPRDFTLVAFGGAGPLFAAGVARELSIPRVLIPRYPGVAAAMGLLASDVVHDVSRSVVKDLDLLSGTLESTYSALEADVAAELDKGGFSGERATVERFAECRYVGQGYELRVPAPAGAIDDDWRAELTRRFHDAHEQEYGNAFRDRGLVIVNVIVRGAGLLESLQFPPLEEAADPAEAATEREVWFAGEGFVSTPIFRRDGLGAGHVINGPAIVEQEDATTVVPPGAEVSVDTAGNLLMTFVGNPALAGAATTTTTEQTFG